MKNFSLYVVRHKYIHVKREREKISLIKGFFFEGFCSSPYENEK